MNGIEKCVSLSHDFHFHRSEFHLALPSLPSIFVFFPSFYIHATACSIFPQVVYSRSDAIIKESSAHTYTATPNTPITCRKIVKETKKKLRPFNMRFHFVYAN